MRSVLCLLMTVLLVMLPVLAASQKVSDGEITDNVRRRLANDPDVKGGALGVDVVGGVVTITGKVKTDKARDKATKLAKKVKGVTRVENKLVVDPL